MQIWREALIAYLWEALKATELNVDLNRESVRAILKTQYGRTWNIYIARFQSKSQFLRYAGRYIRRPPIAEHRFVSITDQEVQFLTKDLKQKRVVTTRYSLLEFVAILTEHVPDRPMYLIMNTSVGGDWPGAPDRHTVLPQYFRVDYVRIYQRSAR